MRSVCLGTVLLKDEELASYLEYGKKQLLLTVHHPLGRGPAYSGPIR